MVGRRDGTRVACQDGGLYQNTGRFRYVIAGRRLSSRKRSRWGRALLVLLVGALRTPLPHPAGEAWAGWRIIFLPPFSGELGDIDLLFVVVAVRLSCRQKGVIDDSLHSEEFASELGRTSVNMVVINCAKHGHRGLAGLVVPDREVLHHRGVAR